MKYVYILVLLISIVLFSSNCKSDRSDLIESGINAQRTLVKVEILVYEKKYSEVIPYLENYKEQLNLDRTDIVLKEMVNIEDILKDINEIISDINTKKYSSVEHDVDRLKVHVMNMKKQIGGDLQLYDIWELETILHLLNGVTEDAFNKGEEIEKLHKALLHNLKTITLSKTGYLIVQDDKKKHKLLDQAKDQLVIEINKYLHDNKTSPSYADFQSKIQNLQESYIKYLTAVL